MTRRVFFSFHYSQDAWRTNQLRNAGVVTGDKPVSPNRWEEIRRTGNAAIKRWIDDSLRGKSCTIVLIGEHTAQRPWVLYEIRKSWNDKRALFGIRIHRLLDSQKRPSLRGDDPFACVRPQGWQKSLGGLIRVYDPKGRTSHDVYSEIVTNLSDWVESAILQRAMFTDQDAQ